MGFRLIVSESFDLSRLHKPNLAWLHMLGFVMVPIYWAATSAFLGLRDTIPRLVSFWVMRAWR